MSMKDWAKREIEIACEGQDDECSYYRKCCESALKAYDTLCEDGHSGMSIQVTRQVLNRLILGMPLTPIRDTNDIWDTAYYNKEKKFKSYQCKRMSSLFKRVAEDGKIIYSDNDRAYGFDIDSPNCTFYSGRVTAIIDEMFPITMPYYPSDKKYGVAVEDFLVDPDNGDFDTMGILYVIKPNGEREDINKFYHETKEGFKEISKNVYDELKRMAKARVMKGE